MKIRELPNTMSDYLLNDETLVDAIISEAGDLSVRIHEVYPKNQGSKFLNQAFLQHQVGQPLTYVIAELIGYKGNTVNEDTTTGIQVNSKHFPTGYAYTQGDIGVETGIRLGSIASRFIGNKMADESLTYFVYRGYGTVVFPPNHRENYLLLDLEPGEKITVDSSTVALASASIDISTIEIVKDIPSIFLNGKGLLETKLTGPGIVMLRIPCHRDELHRIDITTPDKVTVDGSFVIARSSTLQLRTRPAKGFIGSLVSKDGIVTEYIGTGTLILNPICKYYDTLDEIERRLQS